jgi:molecular chaperone GrpE (heat shock protein)
MIDDETGKITADTVSEEYQAGYKLNDRVIRPATVKVTKVKA